MTRRGRGLQLHIALLLTAWGAGGVGPAYPQDVAGGRPAAPRADFQRVWARFRAAVLANDLAQVADLTAFPLTVHGLTDEEVAHVGRRGFEAAFGRMLKQHPDGAGSPSNLDRIRATPRVDDPGVGAGVSVGGVEFERTAAGPRLVLIYVDEE